MFDKLGELYWPFVAAVVAIITLSVSYEEFGAFHFSRIDPFAAGVIVATLQVTILYSALRFALERIRILSDRRSSESTGSQSGYRRKKFDDL